MRVKTIILPSLLGLALMPTMGQALTPVEELGKAIFLDINLSANKNQSCATCHAPEAGWTGPDSAINALGAVYQGSILGRFGDRKPPSSAYATQSPILHYILKNKNKPELALFIGGNFWDGRATGERLGNPAADQAQGPFLNVKEQALPDSACVVYRVCTASGYPVSFDSVWKESCSITWPQDIDQVCATEGGAVTLSVADRAKSDINYDLIALAIAAFEASPEVNAFTSKFDYSRKGQAKLTRLEQQGWMLFKGKGKCAKCHVASGQKPLFTDYTFDNLGIPQNLQNPAGVAPAFVDNGLGSFLATRTGYAAYADANMGKHKVPTLRNVAKGSCEAEPSNSKCITKAYGHNGYFKSLEEIVHFYNTRDVEPWPVPEVAENVNTDELGNLGLTADEEAAIVAFMKTLSDGYQQ